jgi:hypothetical protein
MHKSNKKAKRDGEGSSGEGADAAAEGGESYTDFIYMGFPSRTFDAFPMLGKLRRGDEKKGGRERE